LGGGSSAEEAGGEEESVHRFKWVRTDF
jgi:hypothetical protein